MDIRKISIGPDYKSGAMHYLVGQHVLGGRYTIHLIQYESESSSHKIWIENPKTQEVLCWKEFTSTVPISVEYNIEF
jgi:hypothetical protein